VNPIVIGTVVFACTFGGALAGIWLRSILPKPHFDDASRNTVTVGIGLIATMTALILGLVTASVKNSFDALDTGIKQAAVEVLTLDRLLARYGPETGEIRAAMKQTLALRIDLAWGQDRPRPGEPGLAELMRRVEGIVDRIQALSPQNDVQRGLRSRALDLSETVLAARWGAFGTRSSSVPVLFLVVLLFWLTMTFASFGLFAPRNGTVIVVLFVCALSVAGAVFLILEMDSPFEGLVQVSAEPLRFALSRLNQ
jgi:hypothetical protein